MSGSPLVFSRAQLYFVLLLILSVLLIQPNEANASRKKIDPSDIATETISVKVGKKTKSFKIKCFKGNGGRTKGRKKLSFTSFKQLKKRARSKKKAKLFGALAKKSKPICKAYVGAESTKKYRGNFGFKEAHKLYARFGLSADFRTLQEAVNLGLDRTVDKLTTWTPEPELESIMADYRCDRRFAWDENNRDCKSYLPNDFDITGLKESLLYALVKTKNPYFYRIFLFLHDERATAGLDNLRSEERYAVLDHVDMLMNASISGDMRQFSREFNVDHIAALKYLDNALNDGANPNENWAREFWELHTTDPVYYNRRNQLVPVYTPLDIAQASLAHSGWTFTTITRESPGGDYRMIVKAFSPIREAPGTKIIFQGTPYETVVRDADELVEATFRHPAYAQSLAKELLKLTIKPNPSPKFVKKIAKQLTKNGFNIHPVLKTLAKSEALYSKVNEKTIVKLPIDTVIGFLRATNYPYYSLSHLRRVLGSLEQKILDPETVFGWNEYYLATDRTTINRRNAIREFIARTYRTSPEDEHDTYYSFYDNLTFDLYTQLAPSSIFIDRITSILGVTADKATLDYYLNYTLVKCNPSNDSDCNPTSKRKYKRTLFDFHPDKQSDSTQNTKIRGALLALSQLGEFYLK